MLQQISVLIFINYSESKSLLKLDKLKLKMYPMLALNLRFSWLPCPSAGITDIHCPYPCLIKFLHNNDITVLQ